MAQNYDTIRVKVRIGDKEVEVSYPLTPRTAVEYTNPQSTLRSAVMAVKDIVKALDKEE